MLPQMSTLLPAPRLSYWGHLWRVELVVLLCLLLYALAFTALLGLGAAVFAPEGPSVDRAALPFALILWFSVLPAVLLFAPAYALVRWRGWTNLALALVIGAATGAVFLRAGPVALYAIASAVIIAAAAHLILRRI
jgi:hypothetical protein